MKKIFLFLLLSILLGSIPFFSFAQQGAWAWMKGNNFANGSATYGTQGVSDPANNPMSLYEPAEWTDLSGNFWLLGGMDNSGTSYNALWKFDPTTEEWTWVSGSNLCCASGVYGTQGVPDPANHPGARKWAAATWTDHDGNFWIFGGDGHDAFNNDGDLNDLWKYDITTNEWTWMKGSTSTYDAGNFGTKGVPSLSNNPSARHECAARWIDTAGNLWLFAGANYTNDVWMYNISTNEWTWMHGENNFGIPAYYGALGVSSPNNTPGGRCAYNKWTDADGNFWLFGGYDGYYAHNDLWRFNPSTVEWTWMAGANNSNQVNGVYSNYCEADTDNLPAGRYENRACWIIDNKLIMMGGFSTNTENFNDLTYFNMNTNEWSLMSGSGIVNQSAVYGTQGVADSNNHPSSRGGGVGWLSNDCELWYFGGANFTLGACYNDLWKFIADTTCGGCLQLVSAGLAASDTQLCEKFCIDFTDQSTNNPVSWQWIFEGASPATSTEQNPENICYDDPGLYDVTLIATSSGGASDTITLTDFITVHENPFAPTISQSGNVLTSSFGTTYQWYLNGEIIPGATDQSYEMVESGLYTVIITNENSCNSQSSVQAYLVGINDVSSNFFVNVFANPSSNSIVIQGRVPGDHATLRMFNLLGEELFKTENLSSEFSMKVASDQWPSSVYLLQITAGDQTLNRKILISR